jgi:hypothetical protein
MAFLTRAATRKSGLAQKRGGLWMSRRLAFMPESWEDYFHFRPTRLSKRPAKAKMAHGVHTVSNSIRTNLSAHHEEKRRSGLNQPNQEDMKEGHGKAWRASSKGQKNGTPCRLPRASRKLWLKIASNTTKKAIPRFAFIFGAAAKASRLTASANTSECVNPLCAKGLG